MQLAPWFRVGERLVCVPAKCGGTAFYRAAFSVPDSVPSPHVFSYAHTIAQRTSSGPYTKEEASAITDVRECLLAVRHPVARFYSLWRDKCRDGDENMPELRGKTPEQLLSFVREHAHYSKLNAHWAPQYLHAIAGNRAVYSLHLLKVLRLKAPARELCNETTGALQEYATPLLHEVADFYARDVELFKCAA